MKENIPCQNIKSDPSSRAIIRKIREYYLLNIFHPKNTRKLKFEIWILGWLLKTVGIFYKCVQKLCKAGFKFSKPRYSTRLTYSRIIIRIYIYILHSGSHSLSLSLSSLCIPPVTHSLCLFGFWNWSLKRKPSHSFLGSGLAKKSVNPKISLLSLLLVSILNVWCVYVYANSHSNLGSLQHRISAKCFFNLEIPVLYQYSRKFDFLLPVFPQLTPWL